MKIRQISMVAMSVLLLSGALSAQLSHRSADDAFKTFLNLTADQAAAVNQEIAAAEQRRDSLSADLAQVRGRCEEAMQAGDGALVGNLTLQAKSIEDQIWAERRACRERVTALLTPAQSEKLKLAQEVLDVIRSNPGALESLLVDRMFKREYHPSESLRRAPEQVHIRDK